MLSSTRGTSYWTGGGKIKIKFLVPGPTLSDPLIRVGFPTVADPFTVVGSCLTEFLSLMVDTHRRLMSVTRFH